MIKLDDVSKKLGDFKLENINLNIQDNEYFVILGPTGTGKTVILETIAGLYKPDTGTIFFDNIDVTNTYPETRNIGFVYQDYVLFPHLTVKENIIFGLKIRKADKKNMSEKLVKMTELLNLSHLLDRHPSTLSGGEQQRVAIARVMVLVPDILLLDEPLSALDPRTKENFIQELKKIHKEFKTTTIHITHDFNEAMVLADRICVMQSGKIVQIGTPEEIFNRPNSEFVANFIGSENIFPGKIVKSDDNTLFQTQNTSINISTHHKGIAYATIRPERIFLSNNIPSNKMIHTLKSSIKDMIPNGNLIKVKLDSEIPLTTLITKQYAEELNLFTQKDIYASFNYDSVHIFK